MASHARHRWFVLLIALWSSGLPTGTRAGDLDEFKVKRQDVFEFTEKPKATRDGDKVTITFSSKGYCDATVAVEDEAGRIVRHLASGVLGPNAPTPFQKDSLKQAIIWDSKNDAGEYVREQHRYHIRVSLGLHGRYERPLFHSPYKRLASFPPVLCAAPEGVYVFEGQGADLLRLYDHEGNYARTVYPFPAGRLQEVKGLQWQAVPQLGREMPKKLGYTQATLLTSGGSSIDALRYSYGNGFGASAMAVRNGKERAGPQSGQAATGDSTRIALLHVKLNRLAGDSTTGGLPLAGPTVGFVWQIPERNQGDRDIGPTAAAFSPDGRTLYLTGYLWRYGIFGSGGHAKHGVYKLDYEGNGEPTVFAGNMEMDKPGPLPAADGQFAIATSVATDAQGRVYVGDYLNDRVQVFDPAGKHLKNIAVGKPACVRIDPRTQEIYVLSWWLGALPNDLYRAYQIGKDFGREFKPTMTRFGPLANPATVETVPLPLPATGASRFMFGQPWNADIDFWADPPTIWVVAGKMTVSEDEVITWGKQLIERAGADEWAGSGVQVLARDGKPGSAWRVKLDFATEAAKAVHRVKPPDLAIQRLYASPVTHKLYLLEHLGFSKSAAELLEIDPASGKVTPVKLPFRAEDVCFDTDGLIYLRTDREVVRYRLPEWREVPWDYGEEYKDVTFGGQPKADVISGLPLPGARPMWYHQYGMWVSPTGHIAVSCVNRGADPAERTPGGWKGEVQADNPTKYTPQIYPGRARHQEIHIWDKHGKPILADAAPGLGIFHGLGIDAHDNLYVMSQGTRMLGDKPYFNRQTGTLIKLPAGQCRVLSDTRNTTKRYAPFAPVPLPEDEKPKRRPDTTGRGELGNAWFEGANWFYGGVGIVGAGCICWHTRFQLDYFARSFAPEPDAYSVAVLDSAGNLMTRIGTYGNADDGVPLIRSAGSPAARPLPGDGVPMFYPAYVGVDTDRRLFVSDIGNYRITGVKLEYQATERAPLPGDSGPDGKGN